MEWESQYHDCLCLHEVNSHSFSSFWHVFHSTREQQPRSEPCSELELIAIRACAATLCCGTINDEWFQKTVAPWLDQFMAAHEVRSRVFV